MALERKKFLTRDAILNELRIKKFGTSAQSISESLKLARNTVIKYLEELQKEELAYEWNIGRYRLWIYRDFYLYLNELKSPQDYVIYKFFRIFLKELQKDQDSQAIDWKDLGKRITPQIDWEGHLPEDYVRSIKTLYEHNSNDITLFSEHYPALFESTLRMLGDANASVQPPIVNQNPPFVILRINNSEFTKSPLIFEVICGIKEVELRPFYNSISINIIKFHPKEELIDIKFSF